MRISRADLPSAPWVEEAAMRVSWGAADYRVRVPVAVTDTVVVAPPTVAVIWLVSE